MFEPGEIVVERRTGQRALVVEVTGPDQVACRFADGRREQRFIRELDPIHIPAAIRWLARAARLFRRRRSP